MFFLCFLNIGLGSAIYCLVGLIIMVRCLGVLTFAADPDRDMCNVREFLSVFGFLVLPMGGVTVGVGSVLECFPLLLMMGCGSVGTRSSEKVSCCGSGVFKEVRIFLDLLSGSLELAGTGLGRAGCTYRLGLCGSGECEAGCRVGEINFGSLFFFVFRLTLVCTYVMRGKLL